MTGTVRANRLNQVPVKKKNEMGRRGVQRGEIDVAFKDDMVLVGWKDSKPCYVASNRYPATLDLTCRRYNKTNRQFIQVPQPMMIGKYNHGMGGVDLLDNMVAAYRSSFHQKKWWYPFYRYVIVLYGIYCVVWYCIVLYCMVMYCMIV